MPREYEDPISIRQETGRDEIKITHPAFAQIRAGRVSGGTHLYGSDFQHHHYVVISISRSELNRHLSTDWPFAQDELIEVALSESQWATFVSTMNAEGTQCTIQHINRKQVPQIPEPRSTIKDFKLEGAESAREALAQIDMLVKEIQGSKLSQKQKDEWSKQLEFIRGRTRSSLRFVLQQFGEHMETTVNKAKTEISAYANHLIVRSGLSKLMGSKDAKKVLGYEDRSDE